MNTANHTGGGIATHTGTDYQNRVAAWTAVQILAEQDATPPWDLPASVTLETLHAETPNAIDDIAVGTSSGGRALAQAKHTVTLDTAPGSAFGKTITQCVNQYCTPNEALDNTKDRFVLVTSLTSSARVRLHLPHFLKRMRTSPQPAAEWTSGNADEQEAAGILREHISRAWKERNQALPTDDDVLGVLRLVYVHVLDVDPGGQAEREAKGLLRQSILADPTTADAAWNTLIAATAGYARSTQRVDRTILQRTLTDAGITIRAPRSYRADIGRLKEHTKNALDTLADFTTIYVGNQTIQIIRDATSALHTAATSGHLLILGLPGAGKSGALHNLATTLQQHSDVVVFAAEQLDAGSTGNLRTELGLTHDVTSILAAWPGTGPAYLVIDALDAARTDAAAKTLQTIISAVIGASSRWHVVASVRKWDLRYSPALQRLFHGTPPSATYTDAEFPSTHHVNIPTLSDAELAQLRQQSPALASIIDGASQALRELLQLPFNMRLLGDLLGIGISPAALQPVRTQIELLDRYWQERIIRADSDADARELVLRRMTTAMVAARALRIPRSVAIGQDTRSSGILHDLLSTHVLAEWITQAGNIRRELLTFPHHVLYDYAVARLSIPPEPGTLRDLLAQSPDLLIAIHPSLELHCQRLWYQDHREAWDLTFAIIADDRVPEVGKLLSPSIIAAHAKSGDDFGPLRDRLNNADATVHEHGMVALRHLLSTLVANATSTGIVQGTPWCQLLEAITTTMTLELAFAVRPSTWVLTERTQHLNKEELECLGRVARRLLAFALTMPVDDRGLRDSGIDAVTNTAGPNPSESIVLLRACIKPDELREHGHRTLLTLAKTVPTILGVDATFVCDLYVAAQRHQQTSTDATHIGGSQILPLRSNRRQDYQGGLYQLGEHGLEFFRKAPTIAVEALLAIVTDYVQQEHPRTNHRVLRVSYNDAQTAFVPDGSGIWDSGGVHDHEVAFKMLSAFRTYLAEQTNQPDALNAALHVLIGGQPPAIVWRRLLAAATQQPNTLGHLVRSLAWDQTILTSPDSTRLAGEFLRAIHHTLSSDDRERIESTILAIPASAKSARLGAYERDRLLGCLQQPALVTSAARQQYAIIADQGGPPSNDEDTEAHWGTLHPAPTPQPPEQPLLDPVTAFVAQSRNTAPDADTVREIIPRIKQLSTAIAHAESTRPPPFALEAWSELANACVILARNENVTDEQRALLLPIVMDASINQVPHADPDEDQRHPVTAWSSRAPRISAAEGITLLARYEPCCTEEARDAILRLSTDPVPAVRLQIASFVGCLYITAPKLFWDFLNYYAHTESNPTVLRDALGVVRRLPPSDTTKAADITAAIFARIGSDSTYKDVRHACIDIFRLLALWADDAQSTTIIDRLLADPIAYAEDLQHLILGVGGELPAREPRITERAFHLLHRTLTSVIDAMHALEAQHQRTEPPPALQEQYGSLLLCANELTQRLYFASGAFKNQDNRTILPADVFYEHARPLIVILAEIGQPHIAHYLLDTLKYFIATDPPGVLLLVGTVVRAGNKYGYQYEQLAQTMMVDIIEQYLAQYRPILREHRECHTVLMEILDVFVRVGWPSAHLLTYRLGEIYR